LYLVPLVLMKLNLWR